MEEKVSKCLNEYYSETALNETKMFPDSGLNYLLKLELKEFELNFF